MGAAEHNPDKLPFDFDPACFPFQPCCEVVVVAPGSKFEGVVGRATTVDWNEPFFDPFNNPEDRNNFPWFVDFGDGVRRTFRTNELKRL